MEGEDSQRSVFQPYMPFLRRPTIFSGGYPHRYCSANDPAFPSFGATARNVDGTVGLAEAVIEGEALIWKQGGLKVYLCNPLDRKQESRFDPKLSRKGKLDRLGWSSVDWGCREFLNPSNDQKRYSFCQNPPLGNPCVTAWNARMDN